MVSATGSVLSAPVITVYLRRHKDCPHSGDHFYKGKGCNCRKRLRWTQNGKRRDVSAKTPSWAEQAAEKLVSVEGYGLQGSLVGAPAFMRGEERFSAPGKS